ncbi:type II toxin-antitoxin system RelE/ParE family toxin [Jeotgalibaca caeni]|uniref:type II toxin-antitoxin system RelE/ParE family toxin n=1 Tax=Jeotgalibaca caeni TaxID=3028623 RepID=UPI00237E294E|nr:type II toxin-antitoxin system RelE/ParE family toxin [Jeotgalibaca caeni]MDE1549499.1 type II toxin-antitoxin system RelE/ParE family toxin [Jeotgalibaca caeni]
MVKPEFDWGDEFEEYLNSLSLKDEAKFRALIERVEKTDLVDSIRKERVKKLDDDLYELRASTDEHWMRGCYFQVKGSSFYITHGFSKKTKKTPIKEIKRALAIRKSFFSRMNSRRDE